MTITFGKGHVLAQKGEAAAVTALIMEAKSMGPRPKNPVLMVLDHPFQFWIYDGFEDVVLFEGHVGAPGIPTGSLAPLLSYHVREKSQGDPDQDRALFWHENFQIEVEEDPAVESRYGSDGDGKDTSDASSRSPSSSSSAIFSMLPGSGLRLFPAQSMLVGFVVVMMMTVLMWTRHF